VRYKLVLIGFVFSLTAEFAKTAKKTGNVFNSSASSAFSAVKYKLASIGFVFSLTAEFAKTAKKTGNVFNSSASSAFSAVKYKLALFFQNGS